MSTTPEADDSILPTILRAQERTAEQLSASHMREAAERLVALARSLGYPLLMPVSRDAERLVGAALLIGGDEVTAATGGTYLAGARVLLIDAVVVQMGAIEDAAFMAQRAGAEVVGAAVLDRLGVGSALDLAIHALMAA